MTVLRVSGALAFPVLRVPRPAVERRSGRQVFGAAPVDTAAARGHAAGAVMAAAPVPARTGMQISIRKTHGAEVVWGSCRVWAEPK